jgi:hypothetical protein
MAYGSYPTKSVRLNQSTKERQMSKFKVGDLVKVVGPIGSARGSIGEEGKIISVLNEGYLAHCKDRLTDYKGICYTVNGWLYSEDALELIGGDNVESPSHYGQGKIECIEYIRDFLTKEEYIGYLRGNIAKYMHRWRYKNGEEDLKKARWYLEELIKQVGES